MTTQPPKPKRVRRPRLIAGMSLTPKDDSVVLYYPANIYMNPQEARTRAAWLLRAAAWIDQQQKGAKRGR